MPELPEVETTVRGLRRTIVGEKISDVWSDSKKSIKRPKSFSVFRKRLTGETVKSVSRRGKNVLIHLNARILLIHQKMTGHLLFGRWKLGGRKWISAVKGPLLTDPRNDYIHFVVFFKSGKQMALSDLRKFAKIELWDKSELDKELGKLGPEPLEPGFTFKKFRDALGRKPRAKIKQVLMDQSIVAGIGNIYSDEILWDAKVNPFRVVSSLSEEELKKIYGAIKKILGKAVRLKGTSISDFRLVDGSKGEYESKRKAYQRENEKCSRCGSLIKRKKLGGRSAHFCPKCQKL